MKLKAMGGTTCAAFLAAGLALYNCGSSSDSDKNTEDPQHGLQLDACEGDDLDACADAVSAQLTSVTATLKEISGEFLPGSLAISSDYDLRARHRLLGDDDDDDSCVDEEGEDLPFSDCQPELLAAYTELAGMPMVAASILLEALNELVAEQIRAGERNFSETIEDEDGVMDLAMRITSSTNFKLLTYDHDDGTRLFFSMEEEGDIRLKMFFPEDEEDSATMGDMSLSFSSDKQWHAKSRFYFDGCQGDGPNIIAVNLERDSDIWRGKAMIYDVGETACNETDHPGQAGWYTDFVSDDKHTTASLYFFPMDVTAEDLASPEGYGFDKLCDNIPDHQFCAAQYALEFLPEDLAEFKNPFCVAAGESPSWDAACESDKTEIEQAGYSAASGWILPKELRDGSVCVPTDIDDLDSCVSF